MRISDWSSDVCSSDLHRPVRAGKHIAIIASHWRDAAFLHARLRDDPERPERLNNLPLEKFAAALGFDADRGKVSPPFVAALGVDGILQNSAHYLLLTWNVGTWRAALNRRAVCGKGSH